jgi:RHS repeat-associated protein
MRAPLRTGLLTFRFAAVLVLAALCPRGATAQAVEYYHLDGLGSVRAVTDQGGAVIERHDYLPFGEEVSPPGGAQPRQFTGKERDAETGMDYFGARYYSGKRGRFTTVDPVYTWAENLTDPQRWNRYAYVRNNPLRYTDPDGRILFDFQEFKANLTEALHFGQSGHGYLVPTVAGIAAIGSAASDGLIFAGGAINVIKAAAREGVRRSAKAASAPGVTAGGQATDRYGNKLGPSGKEQINTTTTTTREGARNRALNEGSGAVEHATPKKGGPHFHPTDNKGNKVPASTHHDYPKK